MEAWRVRKKYQALAHQLRKARHHPAVRRAESDLVAALAHSERLESELVAVHYSDRLARGRLTRLLRLLRGLRGETRFPGTDLASGFRELATNVASTGSEALATFIDEAAAEFANFEQQASALRLLLEGVRSAAFGRLENLLLALHQSHTAESTRHQPTPGI